MAVFSRRRLERALTGKCFILPLKDFSLFSTPIEFVK